MSPDSQTSSIVLLVRPEAFGFHGEAARSNAFARDTNIDGAARRARAEFDVMVAILREAGVTCLILDDEPDPPRPDAAFPNNWVSFHGDGSMVLYPMATHSRRLERRAEAVKSLVTASGLAIDRVIDLSPLEADGIFLEGTGSLVLDRPNRRAFAALSQRTHRGAIDEFDRRLGYSTLVFRAADRFGRPIYHSNVLMSLGREFAILCTDAVAEQDRQRVIEQINRSGRELIPVNHKQMEHFACNILELEGGGHPIIAMSATARDALDPGQREALERHGRILSCPIPSIESVGGGSVRCMIAAVHLPSAGQSRVH